MRFSVFLIIGLLAGFVTPAAGQNVSLIETGTFHGDEVSAKNGETWLGLYDLNGNYLLTPSVLTVETVFDPVVDSGDQATGASISVPGPADPLFLVRGKGFELERPVSAVVELTGKLNSAAGVTFRLGSGKYRLFVESESVGTDNFVSGKSTLYLSDGKVKQVLYQTDECDSCRWDLNWAGDIDSDGKPDLYLFVTHHYNVSIQKLFLSSRAENGKLVHEVAEFKTTGC